jgi:hypothetical protein
MFISTTPSPRNIPPSSAVNVYTHKTSSTLFFLALATKSLTFSAPASSKSDLPISTPSTIFLKVKAIPPQMMSELTCGAAIKYRDVGFSQLKRIARRRRKSSR